MRGYVIADEYLEYDDNGELTMKSQIRKEMVEKLAGEWNNINRKIEERSWRSRDERMDEADYHGEMAEEDAYSALSEAEETNPNLTPEEKKEIKQKAIDAYYSELDKKENEIYLRKQVIEELLNDLGARMMRPYEHWNEDEKYYEYMENRYDNERDWDY